MPQLSLQGDSSKALKEDDQFEHFDHFDREFFADIFFNDSSIEYIVFISIIVKTQAKD